MGRPARALTRPEPAPPIAIYTVPAEGIIVHPEQLLRIDRVTLLTGLSRAAIYEMAGEGRFPKAVQLTGTAVAWRAWAVIDWMKARPDVVAREMKGGGVNIKWALDVEGYAAQLYRKHTNGWFWPMLNDETKRLWRAAAKEGCGVGCAAFSRRRKRPPIADIGSQLTRRRLPLTNSSADPAPAQQHIRPQPR